MNHEMDPKEHSLNIEKTLSQSPNKYCEASNVEACRICLATDVKMYSLQNTHLGCCMESITGLDKSVEGLPNYVCYECAAGLIKCNKLIEKSRRAQATFRDILAKNRQITKTLIEEENRSQLNLQSPLDSYVLINYFHIVSSSDLNTSDCTRAETDLDEKLNILSKNEIKEDSSHEDTDLSENDDNKKLATEVSKRDEMSSDDDVQEIKVDIPIIEVLSDDDGPNKDDFISLKPYAVKTNGRAKGLISHKYVKPIYNVPKIRGVTKMRPTKDKAKKGRIKKMMMKMFTSPTPEESYMQKYFNVDVIPVQKTNNVKYSCKFCFKSFYNIDNAKDHRFIGCSQSQSGNTANLAISFSDSGHNLPKSILPLFWEDWNGSNV